MRTAGRSAVRVFSADKNAEKLRNTKNTVIFSDSPLIFVF